MTPSMPVSCDRAISKKGIAKFHARKRCPGDVIACHGQHDEHGTDLSLLFGRDTYSLVVDLQRLLALRGPGLLLLVTQRNEPAVAVPAIAVA